MFARVVFAIAGLFGLGAMIPLAQAERLADVLRVARDGRGVADHVS
jgi:hypothetical protein